MSLNELFAAELSRLEQEKLLWNPRTLEGPSTNRARYNGKKVLLLCANNYLGLSTHPALSKAAIAATKKYGVGSGSVRAIAGTMDLHIKLEKQIAKFKKTDAATYYQSGFTVNSGLIPAITTEKWLIISDELNHGSIIDGVRLSKAQRAVYAHNDMESLRQKLLETKGQFEHTLLITDGVFSMDGDIAPLDKIVELAREFDAYIYVDDAHGDGVLGKHGRGIVEHFGLHGKIDIEMGTFSKAFGTVGGYVCGSQELCDFAKNKSRTYLLTGSHPPATVAASTAALQLLEKSPKLVSTLWKNRTRFVNEVQKMGFNTGNSQTPIVPLMLGESSLARRFSEELYKQGVYALPIVFPMVAQGKARIRTQLSAAHTNADLDMALDAIQKVGQKLQVI